MNENSSFKKKKLKDFDLERDEIFKSNKTIPLNKDSKTGRDKAMIFEVFILDKENKEKTELMSFTKNIKKSNKK